MDGASINEEAAKKHKYKGLIYVCYTRAKIGMEMTQLSRPNNIFLNIQTITVDLDVVKLKKGVSRKTKDRRKLDGGERGANAPGDRCSGGGEYLNTVYVLPLSACLKSTVHPPIDKQFNHCVQAYYSNK